MKNWQCSINFKFNYPADNDHKKHLKCNRKDQFSNFYKKLLMEAANNKTNSQQHKVQIL